MNQPDPCHLPCENRFPNCVSLELYSVPIELRRTIPSVLQARKKSKEMGLQLTIRFYKQIIKVPGGEVEFGLKRGVLDVRLTNGKMPLGKIGLTAPFEPAIEMEEQEETGKEGEASGALTGGNNTAVSVGFKSKRASKFGIKTKFKHSRVVNWGTEENPVWEFSMKPHLIGQLTEELLGTIERIGEPCSIEATFTVRSQPDIQLFNSTGLLRAKNLSDNKTALLTREFFLRFIAPKLQPYLSHVKGEL